MNHIQYLDKQLYHSKSKCDLEKENKKLLSELIRLCEFIVDSQNMDANVIATQILERHNKSNG